MTPLVLSADDFGYHAGIDAAVLDLAMKGRLTATSCLTMSPRWREAASTLTPAIRSLIDVGVHLDFTEFDRPMPWNRLAVGSLAGRLDTAWIRARIAAQLDAFENMLGTPPDYIDGHQHVHQLPQIRTEVLRELQRRYVANRPWIRISQPARGSGFKGKVIGWLGSHALDREAKQAGFSCSEQLLGVYAFNLTNAHFRQHLQGWLQAAKRGDALMLHPASKSPADDPIGSARTVEYEVLGSEWFADLLARENIRPVRGRDVLEA